MDASIDKKWLSYGDQLELLVRRGMRVEDQSRAEKLLSYVSYYRLSGYFRYWQKDPSTVMTRLSMEQVLRGFIASMKRSENSLAFVRNC